MAQDTNTLLDDAAAVTVYVHYSLRGGGRDKFTLAAGWDTTAAGIRGTDEDSKAVFFPWNQVLELRGTSA